MFGNFGKIFVHAALVGCLFKERLLNKQERVLQLLHSSRNIKAGRFPSREKVFIRKILPWLWQNPALKKQDPA